MSAHQHSHSHFGEIAQQTTFRLGLSLGLTLLFVGVEAAAGWWSGSLALLSDAGHNLTDVIALGLSWVAIRLSSQPANARRTFGYHRAGILAALINSITLILIAGGIFFEAYQRFSKPIEVESGVLIGVGLLAFLINAGTAWLVKKGSEHDLNLRATFIHLMGDVFSTIGAVAAGVVILFTGWNWLDPLVSILIGLLILWNAWGILRETLDILLESTPHDIDLEKMVADLMRVEGVLGVHDLHVWSITREMRTLSAHILTNDVAISAGGQIQEQVNEVLSHRYGIAHATLQLECANCQPAVLYCNLAQHTHSHTEVHPGD
jgi:cobalt-zinc-cadmium efflux system protein